MMQAIIPANPGFVVLYLRRGKALGVKNLWSYVNELSSRRFKAVWHIQWLARRRKEFEADEGCM